MGYRLSEDENTEDVAVSVPHPFPYQGSKRRLAPVILDALGARLSDAPGPAAPRLVEPFAGSAAVSIAWAARVPSARLWLNDAWGPLAELWRCLLRDPEALAAGYARAWGEERTDAYEALRARFNQSGEPALLLYLLARCVKAAVRFNQRGEFNQAPDRRRRGTEPGRMARQLVAVSQLLAGRTTITSLDFERVVATLEPRDVVYLDPPYEGTTTGRDRRYAQGLPRARLVAVLQTLLTRRTPFALSYDGALGHKTYGPTLEQEIGVAPRWLDAGPSSQATLSGTPRRTTEALYVSPLPSQSAGRDGGGGGRLKRKS